MKVAAFLLYQKNRFVWCGAGSRRAIVGVRAGNDVILGRHHQVQRGAGAMVVLELLFSDMGCRDDATVAKAWSAACQQWVWRTWYDMV